MPSLVPRRAAPRQRRLRRLTREQLVHGVLAIRANCRGAAVSGSARRSVERAAMGAEVGGMTGRV
jgi:hypothetical protein